MSNTIWKCEQVRAGKVCNKLMFNTQEEAESFATRMRRIEPDLFWNIEPVEVSQIWN